VREAMVILTVGRICEIEWRRIRTTEHRFMPILRAVRLHSTSPFTNLLKVIVLWRRESC